MRMPALFALAMLVSAGAAQAQSMPVSDFLAKAEALQSKGAMALFSSDVGLLKTEIQNSGKQLRAEEAAIRRAGNKPAFCMPAKASTDSRELLEHFRSIPPQQRGMTVKTAFAGLMRKKYPCPA